MISLKTKMTKYILNSKYNGQNKIEKRLNMRLHRTQATKT